jgi:HD-GYP domain-containing protein (c-di-GMP phosphodiesterase class II)
MNDALYSKISISRLRSIIEEKTVEVFLRLSKDKFVKIINLDEKDSVSIIDHYLGKGAISFYISKEEFEKVEGRIEKSLDKNLETLSSGELSTAQKHPLILDSIDNVKDLVINLGMGPVMAERVTKIVNSSQAAYTDTDSMEALYEILMQKEGYIIQHGYLTGFICSGIIRSLGWDKDSLIQKIITAALFQNVTLETEQQAKIYDLNDPLFEELDDYSKELVECHPFLSADLMEEGKHFGEKVKKMILAHHEQPSGSGFPGKHNANSISPLEAAFVLSTNFAHRLIQSDDLKSAGILAKELNEVYHVGNYKKVFTAFLAAFTNLTGN